MHRLDRVFRHARTRRHADVGHRAFPADVGAILAVALLVASTAGFPSAAAGPAMVAAPLVISGASPFPGGCGGLGEPWMDAEVQPTIAVNPLNPDNIIAAWQQDRFDAGDGALSVVVGASLDGGRSFTKVTVPGISRCTGGEFHRITEPWISIGADGTVYLSTLGFDRVDPLGEPSVIQVSTSRDGGLNWALPQRLALPESLSAAEFIGRVTADPLVPGTAYMAWNRAASAALFSKTTDGGRTWSEAAVMYVHPPLAEDRVDVQHRPFYSHILVLPDATLVHVFQVLGRLSANIFMSQRSEDGGQTWSSATKVTDATARPQIVDPDTGARISEEPVPTTVAAPDGSVYVAWRSTASDLSMSEIRVVRSADGGRSWTPPLVAARAPSQAFFPTLAVTPENIVGITYYDLRNDVAGDPELTTDVWFVHSHNEGEDWKEDHVAGPFDYRTAPLKGGFRSLGVWYGLAGLPNGFAAAFGMAQPQATVGASDIFFARITVPPNAPPTARGFADRTESDRLTPVRFADASTDDDGAVRHWRWDFGDGASSAEQHPVHLYSQLGAFDVTLTVTDDEGGTASAFVSQVRVINLAPVASGSADRAEADRLTPVQFTDHSTDPEGLLVRWRWDFGDGTGSSEQNPAHQYLRLGSFQVTLSVTDDAGATAEADVAKVKVKNLPPAGSFGGSQGNAANSLSEYLEANRADPASFIDASSDPDGEVQSWRWDFGDGASSEQQNPSHQYTQLGTFTVRLTVTDNDGGLGSSDRTVRVVNLLPTAAFQVDPAHPMVLALTDFVDASTDPDGEPAAWGWTFGDGATAKGEQVSHRYLEGGWYEVRLSIADNDGGAAVTTTRVYVCSPGGEAGTVLDPRHVRLEFEACIRASPDEMPRLLPMGFGGEATGALPGMLWALGAAAALVRRGLAR